MMQQGRSFSGRERNCFFLNTGRGAGDTQRFANVSAISGIDWPDDGRGLALLDWDHDGDLDVWISNRNAPRLRLMRNDTPSQHPFLSLRLQGNGSSSNRDAIGARVEVVLADGDGHPRIKTLKAGEGFISQSTKWLTFGLGDARQIEKVVVRWPDRDGNTARETFSDLAANARYLLVQGTGRAQRVEPREPMTPLTPSAPTVNDRNDTLRVPLVTLFRPPKLVFQSRHNQAQTRSGEGKSVLLNLWGSWCAPCMKELKEFSEREDEIRRAGIDIVALSVDELDPEQGGGVAQTIQRLNSLRFPFTSQFATLDVVEGLEGYDRWFTALNRPPTIPSSFLLDPEGRLAVIYKGRVKVDDLLQDIHHSKRNRKQRWLASAPLPGRTIDHPHVAQIAEAYEATLYYRRGTILIDVPGRLDDAEYCFRESLRHHHDFASAHNRLGSVLLKKNDLEEAYKHFHQAVTLDPTHGWGHHNLARVLMRQGQLNGAVSHLREAVRYEPEDTFKSSALAPRSPGQSLSQPDQIRLAVQLRLAMLMATAASDEMRNGSEAVRWAERVVQATDNRDPQATRALAAAYAEDGRFGEAVTATNRALDLLEDGSPSPQNESQLREDLLNQLDLFRSRQPLRAP